ncbi:MAG: sigma-54-dependent Fis family transcriptional regulator [candidate division NC10 bacterium]|nr:sigma-54-dependent Fis family transcriptional regulator [candidate division NC10 bacterium]
MAMGKASILVVDDEPAMRLLVTSVLKDEGHDVTAAASGEEALQLAAKRHYHLIITDLKMPGISGLQVLEAVRRDDPETAVILLTAFGSVEGAVEAMRKGAAHYLLKPLANPDELRLAVRRVLEERRVADEATTLRQATEAVFPFGEIIAGDPQMQAALELARSVAPTDSTVLITGETGTGKELIARAIHHWSPRADRAFVAVNCAALAETLLESELFGHEKGAFTGAVAQRRGRFELAHGGTLFLDEVGEMSPALQAKLLRVLQERTLERVGGTKTVTVDVRVIAATNRNLQQMVATRTFREDLYYRLSVFPIVLPPLSERPSDVLPLAEHILRQASRRLAKRITGFAEEAKRLLLEYGWPGNIRELQNVVERATILCREDRIAPAHLSLASPPAASCAATPRTLKELERDAILAALAACHGNRRQAAEQLGIGLRTLYSRLKEYGISTEREEEE